MKKIITAITAIAVLLTLTACGNDNDTKKEKASTVRFAPYVPEERNYKTPKFHQQKETTKPQNLEKK